MSTDERLRSLFCFGVNAGLVKQPRASIIAWIIKHSTVGDEFAIMTHIFISYRRDDTKWATGRLFDHLSARFGDDQIFMDISTLQPGEDFVEVIENAIARCNVLLAIIGPKWLGASDSSAERRLDNPQDFVRLEIAHALERGNRVIPVLIDAAEMPTTDTLPENLHALTRRHAVNLRNETFRHDVTRLVEAIEKVMGLDSQVVIAGQWRDTSDNFTSFFRQNGDRVVGFYRSKISGNIGVFTGTVNGDKGALSWHIPNTDMSGGGIARAGVDSEHLTLDYWIGNTPQEIHSHAFRFISDELPHWLDGSEFDKFQEFLYERNA